MKTLRCFRDKKTYDLTVATELFHTVARDLMESGNYRKIQVISWAHEESVVLRDYAPVSKDEYIIVEPDGWTSHHFYRLERDP